MCSKNIFKAVTGGILGDTPKPPKIDIPSTPEVGGTTAETTAKTQAEGASNAADERQKKLRRGTASLVIPLNQMVTGGGAGTNVPR